MTEFEEEVVNILKSEGFEVKSKQKFIDLILEKNKAKIAVEIKSEPDLTLILPKAFGQLMAAKYIFKPTELWLIIKTKNFYDSPYLKLFKENKIRIFAVENSKLIEVINTVGPKHDRKVRRGIDYSKLSKIWYVLAGAGDWLHIAEISRRTNIDESTVRWYLDHYLDKAVEETKIHPKVKLRMVKLKPGIDLNSYIKALEAIKSTKDRLSK